MAVVMREGAALHVPALTSEEAIAEAEAALEEIVAAHRQALMELAPHQEWRRVREDTGWHMEHLGVLLCLRDAQAHNAAPGGVPDRERREESTGTARHTR